MLQICLPPSILARPRHDLSAGLRSFPFRGYVIFMHFAEDRLKIVNILHARRDADAALDDSEH
jgi:toxin ParE1/3/4